MNLKKLTEKIKYGNPSVTAVILSDLVITLIALFVFALFSNMLPQIALPGGVIAKKSPGKAAPAQMKTVIKATAEKPWKFGRLLSDTVKKTDTSYSDSKMYIEVEKIDGIPGVTECPYYLADIYIKDVKSLKSFFGSGEFSPAETKPMDQFAAEEKAVLAVNGDFYYMQQGSCVLRNGILCRDASQDMDIFAVYNDGSAKTWLASELNSEESYSAAIKNAWQIWAFGPALLDDQGGVRSDIAKTETPKIAGENPRTGIGYYEPGHLCLVVTEGRSQESQGMTLEQFAQIFSDLGCSAAYNLDGGGSSCMYFNGKVLNQSYKGRQLPDIIALTGN